MFEKTIKNLDNDRKRFNAKMVINQNNDYYDELEKFIHIIFGKYDTDILKILDNGSKKNSDIMDKFILDC